MLPGCLLLDCRLNTQAIVPLRGIRFSDDRLVENPFTRNWTVLSLRQMQELTSHGGVAGNIEMIVKRLNPDAFLMVSIDNPQQPDPVGRINQRVDSVLGALCLTALLTPENKEDRRQYSPRPLFWAKSSELCELPLIVSASAVMVSGHTGLLGWLSPDTIHVAGGKSLARTTDLMAAIPSIPSTARAMLSGNPLQLWQEPFAGIIKTLPAAFLVGSPAQCVANMVTLAEVCVTPSEDEKWTKRLARLKVITGCEYWTRVQEIVDARHCYVHHARPSADTVAFSALALALQTLCVMHDIAEQRGGLGKAIKHLDALMGAGFPTEKKTHELTPGERKKLDQTFADIPRGPLRKLYWLNHALTDIPWNNYYEDFVIFDEAFCKKCGRLIGPEFLRKKSGGLQFYSCPKCRREICAKHPFASNR
jgi:hypothetical protein